MNQQRHPLQLQVVWALVVFCQTSYAAVDGASGLLDVLGLMLLLASPVLVLLLGLALWRWVWAHRAPMRQPSDASETVLEGSPHLGKLPTGHASLSTVTHPSFWRTVLGRLTLAFFAAAYVAAPCGLLVDSGYKWWQQSRDAINFALGPGLLFCYLPVAIGLLLLLRAGKPWAAAALVAIAVVWLAILMPVGALNMDVATYQKLDHPGPLNYIRLVLPLRQMQLMIMALVLLPVTLLLRGAWR